MRRKEGVKLTLITEAPVAAGDYNSIPQQLLADGTLEVFRDHSLFWSAEDVFRLRT